MVVEEEEVVELSSAFASAFASLASIISAALMVLLSFWNCESMVLTEFVLRSKA